MLWPASGAMMTSQFTYSGKGQGPSLRLDNATDSLLSLTVSPWVGTACPSLSPFLVGPSPDLMVCGERLTGDSHCVSTCLCTAEQQILPLVGILLHLF